jgi:threonine/homoserine/homoserine lactone efflux protein
MSGAMWVAILCVVMGLGVALTPGPSVALAGANTQRGGWRAGAVTAISATLADVAIAAVAITILYGVGDRLAAFVGVIGGVMVLGLGLDAFVVSGHRDPLPRTAGTSRRIVRSFLLELGLPQALLFGLTAVGPAVIHLREEQGTLPWPLLGLLGGCLLLGRLALVTQVWRSGRIPGRPAYRVVCWVAGTGLVAAGLALIIWLGSFALGIDMVG